MPRTILGADTYKDKDLSELIYIYKRRANVTDQQCADWLGVHVDTFRRYKKKPSAMRLESIRIIQRKLNIPGSKMNELLL